MPPDLTDISVLVPRVQRAVEGPTGPPPGVPTLTGAQALELTADAIADAILYSGGLFGHQLIVTVRDPDTGVPTEWHTEAVLDEWEVSFVAATAALSYFFHLFRDQKVSETIINEGQSWDYDMSAALIRDQLKLLMAQRDAAIEALRQKHPVIDRFASIVAVRDAQTAALVEWWSRTNPDNLGVAPGGVGGGYDMVPSPFEP